MRGQNPAAGTRVKRGHSVILDVFSAYVPSPQAAANQDCAARVQGSIARWNAHIGAYDCRCTGGQVWDNRNKLCTARVAEPPPRPLPPIHGFDGTYRTSEGI